MSDRYKDFQKKQASWQKNYRKRKKDAGYKQISILINPAIAELTEGNPSILVDSYIEFNRDKYIELECQGVGEDEYIFVSGKGKKVKIIDDNQVKMLKGINIPVGKKIKMYVDGRIQVTNNV